jgi:hypothetical protein
MKKQKRPKAAPRLAKLVEGKELIFSEVRSGVGSGTVLNQELREVLGIPYAFLTQTQFEEIKTAAGLRDSAQFELNHALRRYWRPRLETKVSPETPKSVAEAKTKLEQALSAVDSLIQNREFFNGPIEFFERTPLQQRESLERTCKSIVGALHIVQDAEERLSRGPGNPGYGPLNELIHHLDFILFKTHGVVLTRSKNRIGHGGATDTPLEYVWRVVQIANLQVAKTTVDTVLKNYIKDRDKNDRNFAERTL